MIKELYIIEQIGKEKSILKKILLKEEITRNNLNILIKNVQSLTNVIVNNETMMMLDELGLLITKFKVKTYDINEQYPYNKYIFRIN